MSWGKPRTRLGEWMFKKKISNEWLRNQTGLNKNTITLATSDKTHKLFEPTKQKIIKALRAVDPSVMADQFWDL